VSAAKNTYQMSPEHFNSPEKAIIAHTWLLLQGSHCCLWARTQVLNFRMHPRCAVERLSWEVAEYLTGSLVRCFLFLGKMVTLVAKLMWEIRAAIPFESSATRREPLVP
jgi:hypothetical protein